jgi:hypothetical protein
LAKIMTPYLLLFLLFLHPTSGITSTTSHPRLYITKEDYPYIQTKSKIPFYRNVLNQYQLAVMHKLNYSAGGVMSTIDECSGCGWRHQLATSLYLAGGPNASYFGGIAKTDVYNQITSLTPATGNWFAGSERNLEQLISSYDILYDLFTDEEVAKVEASFADNANYMYESPPNGLGVAGDMASRLMNPAADRLVAVGLIALTIPNHPNSSLWLSQSIEEFKWMLENGVMEDGAWHEPSTRYHGRVLAAFVPFAFALKHSKKMDPFNDNDEEYSINFKKFLGWYRFIQTPPDRTMGNCSLTPALSDGNWETVWQVTLGWSVAGYVKTDPTYANQLFQAWENACAPVGLEPSPPAMLSSFLFLGCSHLEDGCGDRYTTPFQNRYIPNGASDASTNSNHSNHSVVRVWKRKSKILSSYAVLENSYSTDNPYLIISTSTQRQTEGHEHPDRGSFSMYHDGIPLVLDPGVGWCGYNWFGKIPASRYNGTSFDKNLKFGAWYRGSQSHSMVNFATEGPNIKPENETWRPDGAFGHEWGMRGEAWLMNHIFSKSMDYVDINISKAVIESQLPTMIGYHRRIFANRMDGTYLFWDDVKAASLSDCSMATYNLHVVTQLGWPGIIGCDHMNSTTTTTNTNNLLTCRGLNDIELDVSILRPTNALKRGLLHLEADPLPVQFTSMTGTAGSAPGRPSIGGVLGGDWNAAGNLPPLKPHFPAKTPTWIRINGHENMLDRDPEECFGFITILHPRGKYTKSVLINRFVELNGGATTIETNYSCGAVGSGSSSGCCCGGGTLYLLGDRQKVDKEDEELIGLAGVVGWNGENKRSINHVHLIQGRYFSVPNSGLNIKTSQNVTMTITATKPEQYILNVQSPIVSPTTVTINLPWIKPPKQVNVWRGSHVWHITNTSLNSGNINPTITFNALPNLNYLIERFCIRSMKAGYGSGGWLCDPPDNHNSNDGRGSSSNEL